MAPPSRNRRNATVDSVHFHWVKGGRGDNGRGVITVQLANGIGSKLMIDPNGRITDDQIPDGIRFAISLGWNPHESGPPFCIGFADHVSTESRFVLRCATDPPYWREFGNPPIPNSDGR